MRIAFRGLFLSCALLSAVASQAAAAALPDQSLTSADQVVRWQGKTTDPTGQGYGPPTQQTCTEQTCDSFLLKIDLPAGTFKNGPKNPAPDMAEGLKVLQAAQRSLVMNGEPVQLPLETFSGNGIQVTL